MTQTSLAEIDEAWWQKELARAEAAETKTKLADSAAAQSYDATLFEDIGRAVGQNVLPLIQKLEERITLLEAGLAKHAGPFRAGRSYRAGEFCTRSGSLWHVRKDYPIGEPGDSPDFQLAVKRGEAR
jgi:hypothetical protein